MLRGKNDSYKEWDDFSDPLFDLCHILFFTVMYYHMRTSIRQRIQPIEINTQIQTSVYISSFVADFDSTYCTFEHLYIWKYTFLSFVYLLLWVPLRLLCSMKRTTRYKRQNRCYTIWYAFRWFGLKFKCTYVIYAFKALCTIQEIIYT